MVFDTPIITVFLLILGVLWHYKNDVGDRSFIIVMVSTRVSFCSTNHQYNVPIFNYRNVTSLVIQIAYQLL